MIIIILVSKDIFALYQISIVHSSVLGLQTKGWNSGDKASLNHTWGSPEAKALPGCRLLSPPLAGQPGVLLGGRVEPS